MTLRKGVFWLLAACFWLAAPGSMAMAYNVTPAQIEALREQARRDMQASSSFANTIAGVINLTLSPDLSSAFYNVEFPGESDVDFSTTKLPIYYSFEEKGRGWSPYVGVVLGYLDAKTKVDAISLGFGEKMRWDSNWKGYSGLLEGGCKFEFANGFFVAPGISAGLARLRNSITYLNDFSREVAAPVFDGLSANFSITALMLSGILSGGYDGKLGVLDFNVLAKYTHSYVESIETDDPAQEFNDDIDSLAGRVTLGGPLGVSLAGNPMLWQVFLGGMHFVGQDQDIMGWTYYGELGGTIGLDIRRFGLPLSALRLGASLIRGDNISGWSIVVGYTF
ncbi:MAG: Solitary outer membrane autotransporter beta-barrel domain [Proteobacteria bacterium]|nr:Solitary outer membrane autotransporter beta-barrel domain [Pseudomonadota bacterium]MBU1451971.1 Solitary outer membrane autotransporter beta-barrel domain [Pseudomonadota bacterium]MBU2468985.1 Solitary outer membrane autotransporter beta-barrel domain [Pseudomonadota bacterium]MBU2517686.1 Solitary outer membrane autotransporter beta-barrel domain [Pseudomonadota bacterium]